MQFVVTVRSPGKNSLVNSGQLANFGLIRKAVKHIELPVEWILVE